MPESFVALHELALVGDRRSCALLDTQGTICWYCPGRFDAPSLFASLLDPGAGGAWQLSLHGLQFQKREYEGESALLRTYFTGSGGSCCLEDWMPLYGKFYGICRTLSPTPAGAQLQLTPRPQYARRTAVLQQRTDAHISIDFDLHLYASHPLEVKADCIVCRVPAGEQAWFVLAEKVLADPEAELWSSRKETLDNWQEVARHITYKGPYEQEVRHSLRLLRLLTYAQNGGILAAATTSLPEVVGGSRNYDYRYVWLRDAAMIVSALARAGSDGEEERRFLDFICAAMHRIKEPVVPMLTLDQQPAGAEQELALLGYKNSQPVRYGNGANHQLQLDANSNVLIAAKVIYNRYQTREHWETVQQMANYLVQHWQEKDHGIWEETQKHHYTSSKVIAAVSLEYISEHSEDEAEKRCWQETAKKIRKFVQEQCRTREGAYAAYAGSQAVDISAILFPVWGYTEADTETMLKTVEALEKHSCQNQLFRRHLVEFDAQEEGVFLAGTLWMAQYWVMRKEWEKVERILTAALRFMNDVGLMPEEGNPETGEWLGNLPQAFVHASLIGLIIDYKTARYGEEKEEGSGKQ